MYAVSKRCGEATACICVLVALSALMSFGSKSLDIMSSISLGSLERLIPANMVLLIAVQRMVRFRL